jgi:DNA-directed RNA polymerase beta subunit
MQKSEPPKHTRAFFDPEKLRHMLFDTAVESFGKKINAIETQDYKLNVKNLKMDIPSVTSTMQKKLVLEKKDLTAPLKGTVELIHKASGKVIESKNTTLAQIPYVTNHNTVIYNGSEYEAVNQQRLLPGIYSRIRQDGIPEAHINPEARTGQAARILFLPEKQLFVLMIRNSQVRLYGILKDMGMSDNMLKDAWGEQILNSNRMQYKGDEIDKLYAILVGDE